MTRIRYKLCACLAALLIPAFSFISASAVGGEQSFRMDHDSITYYGRWEHLDNGGVQLNFQSGFEVIFTGTSAAVGIETAGSASEYMYSIDGGEFVRVLNPTAGYNTLATGLAAGEHTLTFYACNQGARNRITGLRFDSGAVLKKVPDKKTIEFIGDSITAGWIGSGYINWLYKCYTWQTAQKLGFGFNVVARGGIGILVKGSDALNMSDRYFRAIPYSETIGKNETYPMYDTSRYTPDYIVVNLGTNDRSYSSSEVEEAYTDFLAALRESYPSATIFALRPLGGRDITGGDGYFKKEIISAVNARRKAGDKNVVFMDTTGWVEVSDFADQLHFNYEGNEHIAERLAAAIEEYIESASGTATTGSGSGGTSSSATASGTATTGSTAETPSPTAGTGDSGTTTVNPTNATDSSGTTGNDPTAATQDSPETGESSGETTASVPTEPGVEPPAGTDPSLPVSGTPSRLGWILGGIAAGLLVLGGGGFALWYFVLRKKFGT